MHVHKKTKGLDSALTIVFYYVKLFSVKNIPNTQYDIVLLWRIVTRVTPSKVALHHNNRRTSKLSLPVSLNECVGMGTSQIKVNYICEPIA